MSSTLDTLLAERTRQLVRWQTRRSSVAISAALHVGLFAAVFLAPLLAARPPAPIEFVPVMLVPVQALGVKTPAPAPSRPTPVKPVPQAEIPASEPKPTTRATAEKEKKPDRPDPRESLETQAAIGQRQGSPLGSSLGTSAFGAAVGGLDNPDFVYGYYVDQMLAMISSNWQRPTLGGEIEAMVYFRIHRDGQISELRVERSSGYNSFDLAGLRAVQLAAPFPRLPQSYRHDSLGVNLILR